MAGSSCLTPGTSHLTLPRLALFRTAPAVASSLLPANWLCFTQAGESVLLPFNPQSAINNPQSPRPPAGWLALFRTAGFCHGMVPRGLPALSQTPYPSQLWLCFTWESGRFEVGGSAGRSALLDT